jgi:hypothetical protein
MLFTDLKTDISLAVESTNQATHSKAVTFSTYLSCFHQAILLSTAAKKLRSTLFWNNNYFCKAFVWVFTGFTVKDST